MIPSQKPGIASPLIATIVPIMSSREFGRIAERMPIGIATSSATAIAIAANWSVTGKRACIASQTGSLVRTERPRSPWSIRPSQSPYWTGSGWSRPSSRRIAS